MRLPRVVARASRKPGGGVDDLVLSREEAKAPKSSATGTNIRYTVPQRAIDRAWTNAERIMHRHPRWMRLRRRQLISGPARGSVRDDVRRVQSFGAHLLCPPPRFWIFVFKYEPVHAVHGPDPERAGDCSYDDIRRQVSVRPPGAMSSIGLRMAAHIVGLDVITAWLHLRLLQNLGRADRRSGFRCYQQGRSLVVP